MRGTSRSKKGKRVGRLSIQKKINAVGFAATDWILRCEAEMWI
jgi:hypothetical protein